MSSHPRVSIIIPIYNAEQHLSDCLQSAVQQTIRDMEIVCVDDASTDSSAQIVADYAAADSRVRLLKHAENKGEGASRNTGIDHARGDYIFHLDADDMLPANAIELLYAEASGNDSDMVKGGFSMISSTGELKNINLETLDRKVVNTNIHASRFLQSIPSSHCSYLYRRQLLNDNGIRYRTNLTVGLDLIALMSALTRADKVTIIPQCVYNYRQSNSGVSRSHFSSAKPIQAIWVKRILYEELLASGLTQAAESIFKKWNFQIFNYWLRMPESLSIEESRSVFFEFRVSLPPLITPWQSDTPHHQRFMLALIYAGRDDDAIDFLKTAEAANGFSNTEDLRAGLEFILTIAPNDIASLYELGRIAQTDGYFAEAASFFQEVIRLNSEHFDARLNLAVLQIKFGRRSDAYNTLIVESQSKFLFENRIYTKRLLSSRNDWPCNGVDWWPISSSLPKLSLKAPEYSPAFIALEIAAILKDHQDELEGGSSSKQSLKIKNRKNENLDGYFRSTMARLITPRMRQILGGLTR